MRYALVVLSVVVYACGGDGGTVTSDASTVDGPPGSTDSSIDSPPTGTFVLTSPAFVEGSVIPNANACSGANTSPQLDWTNSPAAQSYAVVFTDMTNMLVHWVIYDIPGSSTGLPANVQKTYMPNNVAGAHQTQSYQAVRGYLGPCPGTTHSYQFKVHALSSAALPNATMQTDRNQAVTLIEAVTLGNATLTGVYTP